MALPILSGIARLTKDPEVRKTPKGKPFLAVRLAFNSRKKNLQTGAWEDGDVLFIDGSYWAKDAPDIAKDIKRGSEVRVKGSPRSRFFKNAAGEDREAFEMNVHFIAPMVRTSREIRRQAREDREAERSAVKDTANDMDEVPF